MVDILGSIDEKIENNIKKSQILMEYGLILLNKFYINKNYTTHKLNDCLSLLKDGTHNPPKRVEKGVPLITGQTIENGFINYNKITYIKEEDYKKIHSKYSPHSDDLLITKIGTLGKVAILRENDIPITVHCNSALLRFSNLNPALAFFILNSVQFQNEFHSRKNRTVQEFINLEQIGNLEIQIPNITQEQVQKFEILLKSISFIDNENAKLNELKQLYLKKFFS